MLLTNSPEPLLRALDPLSAEFMPESIPSYAFESCCGAATSSSNWFIKSCSFNSSTVFCGISFINGLNFDAISLTVFAYSSTFFLYSAEPCDNWFNPPSKSYAPLYNEFTPAS